MKNVTAKINIDFDITATIFGGFMIVITGIISLFTLKDVGFASTCIVTGAGLWGVAKVANTVYDDAHVDATK